MDGWRRMIKKIGWRKNNLATPGPWSITWSIVEIGALDGTEPSLASCPPPRARWPHWSADWSVLSGLSAGQLTAELGIDWSDWSLWSITVIGSMNMRKSQKNLFAIFSFPSFLSSFLAFPIKESEYKISCLFSRWSSLKRTISCKTIGENADVSQLLMMRQQI